jgi:predicted ArsR family transcriptional regulator
VNDGQKRVLAENGLRRRLYLALRDSDKPLRAATLAEQLGCSSSQAHFHLGVLSRAKLAVVAYSTREGSFWALKAVQS